MRLIGLAITITAGLLTACSTSPEPPTPAQVLERYNLISAAYTGSSMTARDYGLAGMQEVDVRCDRFFSEVMEYNHRTGGLQRGTSLLGSSVGGFMAATDERAEDIAVAAILFSGLDAQIGNYREYELLGPMAGSAQQLVRKARDAYRQLPLPDDRMGAARHVHDYAQLCTFDTIIGFINAAVNQATPVVRSSTASISDADRAVVTGALSGVTDADIAGLTDSEWARLYLLLEGAPTTPALLQDLAKDFPAQRSKLLTSTGDALTPAGRSVLAQLGALRLRSPVFAQQTEALRQSRAAAVNDAVVAQGEDLSRITPAQVNDLAKTIGLPRPSDPGSVVIIQ